MNGPNGFDELLGAHRVMVILRGLPATETVTLAQRAWDAGVRALEVPIGEPHQVAALAAAVSAGRERGLAVGAGTVITAGQVAAAAEAGAAYTVAPGFDPEVLAASRAAGLPHLPGTATPTEVQRAVAADCRWVKAFPGGFLGAAWFTALRGPFPHLNFVATGGITVETAPDFLAAGVRVVALGSALADDRQVAGLAELVARSQLAE